MKFILYILATLWSLLPIAISIVILQGGHVIAGWLIWCTLVGGIICATRYLGKAGIEAFKNSNHPHSNGDK